MKSLIVLFFSLLGLFVWLVLDRPQTSISTKDLIDSIPEIEISRTPPSEHQENNKPDLNIRRWTAAAEPAPPEDYQSPAKEKSLECRDGNRDSCKVLSGLCQERDFDACFYIGQIIGRGNIEKAIKYYKFACDQFSHADSCYELAMTMQPSQNDTNADQINSYFHVACFEGNVQACIKLADTATDQEQRELYLAEASRFQEIKDSGAK